MTYTPQEQPNHERPFNGLEQAGCIGVTALNAVIAGIEFVEGDPAKGALLGLMSGFFGALSIYGSRLETSHTNNPCNIEDKSL